MTAVLKLALALLSVAIAAPFAVASLHITDWSTVVQRVALLPPPAAFGASTALALGVSGLVAAVARWRLAPPATPAAVVQATAFVLTPFALLLLWVVPYAPRVGDRLAALAFLAGRAKWGIAIVATVAVLARARGLLRAGRGPVRPAVGIGFEPARPGSRIRLWIFLIALTAYLGLGFHVSRVEGPGGDEPHYLVITHSLLVDGDLQIENNHRLHHYRAFISGNLQPHYLRRGRGGVIYSIHSPGLSVLLLPGYAVAGYGGAVATMVVMGALTARAMFDLASLAAPGGPAVRAWVAGALTLPFAPHAWLIYPEVPAALVMAWVGLWLWRPPPSQAWIWVLRGCALAILPWLHAKFLALVAVALACLVARAWRMPRHVAALVAPVAVSVGSWLMAFWVMYGMATPLAQYGGRLTADFALANVPRGLLGLLFDYKFGLLPHSPVFLLAAVGVVALLRRASSRPFALGSSALMAALLASVTPYYMWWGGRSAPARFLVPIVPLLVPMLATALAATRNDTARLLSSVAIAWSVGVFALMVARPELSLLFNDRAAPGRLAELVTGGSRYTVGLPTFTEPVYGDEVRKLVAWFTVAALSIAVFWGITRMAHGRARLAAATFGLMLSIWIGGEVIAETLLQPSDRAAFRNEERARLMDAYDDRLVAVAYPALARLSPPEVMRRMVLWAETIGLSERRGEPPRVAGPFGLVPGRYVARVWLRSRLHEYHGSVRLTDRAGASLIAARRGPFRSPIELSFDLPVMPRAVWLETSDWGLARETVLVEIEPRSIVPRRLRGSAETGEGGALYQIGDRPGAYVVYVDESTYHEGAYYWTRGGVPGRTLVAPGGAARLRLILYLGPRGGRVLVEAGACRNELTLAPGEVRTWDCALRGADRFVPVTVTAPGGFRPSDLDPTSDDGRWLGCQVRTELLDE